MPMFKIQFPDGTFSSGGMEPSHHHKGKTWDSRGYLNSHLTMITKQWARAPADEPHPYEGATAVAYDLVIVKSETGPVDIFRPVWSLLGYYRGRIRRHDDASPLHRYPDHPSWPIIIQRLLGWLDEHPKDH